MIECKTCGNILSNGYIIKSTSVIQVNYKEGLVNIKCRKCKNWIERVPLSELLNFDLIKDIHKSI